MHFVVRPPGRSHRDPGREAATDDLHGTSTTDLTDSRRPADRLPREGPPDDRGTILGDHCAGQSRESGFDPAMIDRLSALMARLTDDDPVAFVRHFRRNFDCAHERAHAWDLWAARVLHSGRHERRRVHRHPYTWLISHGRV